MRTLLTGASGYIGLHVVRELLEDKQRVTAVVRSPDKLGPFARDPQLTIVEANLEDGGRMATYLQGHDACVHLALIWGDPGSELEARDVAATAKLFDAAGNAGVRRCIYMSSCAVHRPFSDEMGEEDTLTTTDHYGATKAAGELFLRAACAQHQMTGVVVRPGPVVGPPAFTAGALRTPERILEMLRAAAEGDPIPTVRGDGRQLSDVSTLARVVRLLTRTKAPHPTYTCVDRDVLTWERVARTVVAASGSSSTVVVLPSDDAKPPPRFRTERVESLLGGPSSAEHALAEHIGHLRSGGSRSSLESPLRSREDLAP